MRLKQYLANKTLKIENNPLLAPFFLVVSTSGNEFRNEKKNSKLIWNPEMSEKNKITYERYKKIMKAFPRSVHSGYGSAECFCPDGTETRKEQYAELVDYIFAFERYATDVLRSGDKKEACHEEL